MTRLFLRVAAAIFMATGTFKPLIYQIQYPEMNAWRVFLATGGEMMGSLLIGWGLLVLADWLNPKRGR